MEEVIYHKHTGNHGDGPKLSADESIEKAPQAAIVAAVVGSLTSGGSNDLKSADAVILNNAIARIAALETALKNLKLLK